MKEKRILDYVMCALLVVTMVSGFMLHGFERGGADSKAIMICGIVHCLAAVVFVVLCVVHMAKNGMFAGKHGN